MVKINFNKMAKSRKQSSTIKTKPKETSPTKINKYDVFFDIEHLKYLLYRDDFITSVPAYINKFFFKYGNDIFFDNGETFELLTKDQARQKIPDEYKRTITIVKNNKEVSKDLSLKSYFGHELFLKTYETKLTIDYHQEYKFINSQFVKGFEIKYNYLNMKKDLPRDYNKQIQATQEDIEAVKLFFEHLKLIICSGDEIEYDVVRKFFASSAVGWKVKIALLWQSIEQTGKGTILNYLKDLLGNRMYKTSSIETVEMYNKPFEGTTLLNFDELPVSGTSKTLQDRMKALITEPQFDCRAMYNQPYQQKNTFNIVITSNNNCISLTQTNQIRYYVNTINESYVGNTEYFNKLYKAINKEEVKILIFQEFVRIYNEEVKPINWIGNDLKPTKAGQVKRIEALPHFYKWIKTEFILNGLGIDDKCSDFLTNYQNQNKTDRTTQNKLARYLQDLGVEIKDVKVKDPETGKYKREGRRYIMSYEKLKTKYEQKGWFDNLVDEIPDEETDEEDENPLDHGIDYKCAKPKADEKDEIIDRQNKEIEELKAKLKQLEEQLKPKEVPKPTPKETIQEQLTFKDINDLTTRTIKSSKSKKGKTTIIKEDTEEEKQETKIIDDDIFGDTEFNKFLSMKKK